MKIRLWTIQTEGAWECLISSGYLKGSKDFIEKDFLPGYDWMKNQMIERMVKPDEIYDYPVWAWYQFRNSSKRKPDLRESVHLPAKTKGVRIEFQKEPDEILLSDYELWHFPLGIGSYIADSEVDALNFETAYGHSRSPDNKKQYQQGVEKSWEKVFDMDYCNDYSAQPFPEKQIQATFWILRLQDIIKADFFVAR